jgi:hypothetical protein
MERHRNGYPRGGACLENALKTECVHGHPFTTENTWSFVDDRGLRHRQCRMCNRLRTAARRAKRRAGSS